VPSTSGSNSSRLLDPVSVRCQTKIGCCHEDMEEDLSTETSHRYTVKSHKYNCLATITMLKLKEISRLHANNYMIQGIDPISLYPAMCSGFKYSLALLVVSHIRMLDRHCVGLHTTWCGCQPNGFLLCMQYFKTLCATFTKEWKWEGYGSVI